MLTALRAREFSRLDHHGLAYLDYTGGALYGESQLRAQQRLLEDGIFGNPHSDSAPSRASTEHIARARERVLRFFGVDASTHTVCFTANASAAIRLVAESYPFGPDAPLTLSADNHNSINGVRELARRAGAPLHVIPLDDELRLRDAETTLDRAGGGLFAYPAQSNFSGVLHSLTLVDEAMRRGVDVLLDVASHAGTHPLDLRVCTADYVVLSFYKLFGLPTGVGALVARNESLAKLVRPSFAGGTVLYASVRANTYRLLPGAERFEDGTPNFLGIATSGAGFDLLERAGMHAIEEHVAALTRQFLDDLLGLHHQRGAPLVRVYGPPTMRDRGGVVTFNVLDRRGSAIPYARVEARARDARIAVRGGCFCNPGAAEAAFDLDPAECLDALGDTFTIERFAACTGRAAGAIRVSPGLASKAHDLARMIDVVATFRE